MKRFNQKGAKPYKPPSYAGKPTAEEMHVLNKSPHSMNDYAKMTPMNMTAAMMPVAQVSQFAQKGLK